MSTDPARTSQEARRRLLHDMGIEAWYARGMPGQPPARPGAEESVAAVAPGQPPARPEAEESVAAVVPGQPGEPPFTVVAFGVPGALLVVEAPPRGPEAVLARDVLRATRRDWSAAVRQARFEWPQPGVAGASRRALAAFVEKQAEDFGAHLALVTESAATRLGGCPVNFVTVPDLQALADPQQKRELWRRVQQLQP